MEFPRRTERNVTGTMTATPVPRDLTSRFDSFDPEERRAAVLELIRLRNRGDWTPPSPRPWMNLHAHTFHSFNSEGWSPSRLVAEGLACGWEIVGSVDFDVLDALEEVLETGDLLGIKAVVGLESRVFVPEYADKVLNSPGEPGIAYFMATGCYRSPDSGSPAERTYLSLKQIAQRRNREMIDKVNSYLGSVQVDYQTDLLTRTPSGNPTERHLVAAYLDAARRVHQDPDELTRFWSGALGMSGEETGKKMQDGNAFQDLVRSKLMKRGGPGYADPDPSSFPTVEAMIEMARSMGALPTYAFLDGTEAGENNMVRLLEFMTDKGAAALNIIPDRNWNLKDPEAKRSKIEKLREAVEAARKLALPLCVGTEMNKPGQPFVDDFDAPELAPFVEDFRIGGRALWGHTLMARAADFGWGSAQAEDLFGKDREPRLRFYRNVGTELSPGFDTLERVRKAPPTPKAAPAT